MKTVSEEENCWAITKSALFIYAHFFKYNQGVKQGFGAA
jgi:hypothetical protein